MSTIASAAVAAPPMNIATKLLSIGTDVPVIVRPSSTATSAAAVELPMVRAMAFMLVATPVSPAVDLADDQRGQCAVAQADVGVGQDAGRDDLPRRRMSQGDEQEAGDPRRGRDDEYRPGAEAVDEPAADQRDEKAGDGAGQQVDDAGFEHGGAEAVSR